MGAEVAWVGGLRWTLLRFAAYRTHAGHEKHVHEETLTHSCDRIALQKIRVA